MVTEPKQMIACSCPFWERVTELAPLREAVATYASRAGEKLRAQGDFCQMVQVYIRTGVFNPNEKQYARTASVPLPYPSNETRDLVAAALAGLESIYQPGYRYQKEGWGGADGFCQPRPCPERFAPAKQLMTVLDRVNSQMGRGTLRLARVPQAAGWAMRQSLKSPGYLSCWEQLPIAL